MRSLSQRCAQAAKETASKIEDSVQKSINGVQISAKVAKSLEEIVSKAHQVDELAGEVASASVEQSQGIEQVNTAVSQMDKVTQSNAANAEESASAAEELNSQAENLKEAVKDLLRMVDGEKAVNNTVTPTSFTVRSSAVRINPPARQPNSSKGSGTVKRGRNGTELASEPGARQPINGAGSIAMEHDFKHF